MGEKAEREGKKRSVGVPERLGDAPLRLIIVGHNPSEEAWRRGHVYAHPSNHVSFSWPLFSGNYLNPRYLMIQMWPILRKTGIAPPDQIRGCEDDDKMQSVAGVGFLDLGTGHPGTDSRQFGASHFAQWIPVFYERLRAHAARASAAVGCRCGGRCGEPRLMAFSGKRQFLELLNAGRKGKDRASGGATLCQQAGIPMTISLAGVDGVVRSPGGFAG